jgi:hypothetical protein
MHTLRTAPGRLQLLLMSVTGSMPGLSPDGLEAHLHAAVAWLLRSQAASGDDGLPAYYDIARGCWVASYPETTGYAIPTLLTYAQQYGRDDVRQAALRMAEYEVRTQLADGSFPGWTPRPERRGGGVAFDTGQVLFGLLATYAETGDERYAHAAARAGDWLVTVQQPDGSWTDYHSQGSVRAIDTRTAWALLCLAATSGDGHYRQAARRQLDWTLAQQHPNGWFDSCTFDHRAAPVTHTLAYTTEGLLESGWLLGEERYIASGRRAANALHERVEPNGRLSGAFAPTWQAAARWTCLTGRENRDDNLRDCGGAGAALYRNDTTPDYIRRRVARQHCRLVADLRSLPPVKVSELGGQILCRCYPAVAKSTGT